MLLAKQGGKSNIAARMKVQEALSLAAKMAALGLQEIHGTFAQVFEFANQLKRSHFVGWTSCDSDQSFDVDSSPIHVGKDTGTSMAMIAMTLLGESLAKAVLSEARSVGPRAMVVPMHPVGIRIFFQETKAEPRTLIISSVILVSASLETSPPKLVA